VGGTYQNAPFLGVLRGRKPNPAGFARPSLTPGCSSPPSQRSGGSSHTDNMIRSNQIERETGSTSWFRDCHGFGRPQVAGGPFRGKAIYRPAVPSTPLRGSLAVGYRPLNRGSVFQEREFLVFRSFATCCVFVSVPVGLGTGLLGVRGLERDHMDGSGPYNGLGWKIH
jgi:hypothetical protein